MHVAALAGILPEICKRADQVGRCAALPEDLQHRHAVQEHPEMALEQAYFVRSRLVTGDRGDKMLTVCAAAVRWNPGYPAAFATVLPRGQHLQP